MYKILMVSLITLATTLPGARAGSLKPQIVHQNARWVVHMDVRALLQGQVGQYLLAEMTKQEVNNKFAAFQAIFNFDPRRDLDGVTAFSASDDPKEGSLILHGRFDVERLVILLKANDKYAATTYKNMTLHQWLDNNKKEMAYGCITPDGSVMISNRLHSLEKAVDVLLGVQPNLGQGGSLDLSHVAGTPTIVAVADYAAISKMNPDAVKFQQAKSGSIAIDETQGQLKINVSLEAGDPETATQLQAVAQGLIALTMLGSQDNPEITRLAQAARVALDGNRVSLSLSYPALDMIRIMQEAAARKKAKVEDTP